MLKRVFILFVFGAALSCLAATDPKDLVVFPEKLPDIQNLHTAEMQPVVRADLAQPASEGVQLIPATKSVTGTPLALMSYPVPQSGNLNIQVTDAPDLALAARLGQERIQKSSSAATTAQPKMEKLEFAAKSAGKVTAYLYHSFENSWSSMIMIVPSKTGEDRFLISFSWISASSRQEELTRDSEWLAKVAPLVDSAKLQALP
jgi:hypothetical protein